MWRPNFFLPLLPFQIQLISCIHVYMAKSSCSLLYPSPTCLAFARKRCALVSKFLLSRGFHVYSKPIGVFLWILHMIPSDSLPYILPESSPTHPKHHQSQLLSGIIESSSLQPDGTVDVDENVIGGGSAIFFTDHGKCLSTPVLAFVWVLLRALQHNPSPIIALSALEVDDVEDQCTPFQEQFLQDKAVILSAFKTKTYDHEYSYFHVGLIFAHLQPYHISLVKPALEVAVHLLRIALVCEF